MLKNKKKFLYGLYAVPLCAGLLFAGLHMLPSKSDALSPEVTAVAGKHKAAGSKSAVHGGAQPSAATPTSPVVAGLASKAVATAAAVSTVKSVAVPTGLPLYTYPASSLIQGAAAWSAAHPEDAGVMNRLAAQPIAQWFGDWDGNVQADVNVYVSAATAARALPVLVAYNIPGRDCGGESAGGAASAVAYQTWIQNFAAGIGNRQAIVILEPDALAASCYTDARGAILASAVAALVAGTKASVYLDAGNSAWLSAAAMAPRLQAAGIAQATGFSLNVSNFQTTAASNAYGNQLSKLVGGKHYVVDTSRNGNGPTADNQWCNPAGRAFGVQPTLSTGQGLADAYIWVKAPGESDGSCGPDQAGSAAPGSGSWWPQYALALAANSGW